MKNKFLFGLTLWFSMGNLYADDTAITVKVRKEMRPETKLFLGNTILSTLIGVALLGSALATDALAEQFMSDGRNNKFFNIVDIPCGLVALAGTVTVWGSLLYNIIKIAQYWRTTGFEELERIKQLKGEQTLVGLTV